VILILGSMAALPRDIPTKPLVFAAAEPLIDHKFFPVARDLVTWGKRAFFTAIFARALNPIGVLRYIFAAR